MKSCCLGLPLSPCPLLSSHASSCGDMRQHNTEADDPRVSKPEVMKSRTVAQGTIADATYMTNLYIEQEHDHFPSDSSAVKTNP